MSLLTPRDLARQVKESINGSGLQASEVVVKLVIEEYLAKKRQALINGDSVSEDGIGVVSVTWRRVPKSFSSKRYTTKLRIEMDENLKDITNEIIKPDVDDTY